MQQPADLLNLTNTYIESATETIKKAAGLYADGYAETKYTGTQSQLTLCRDSRECVCIGDASTVLMHLTPSLFS